LVPLLLVLVLMIWVVLLQYSPKNPLLLLLFKEEERDRERIRKSKPCKNPFSILSGTNREEDKVACYQRYFTVFLLFITIFPSFYDVVFLYSAIFFFY
jgi:hypothetical protein